MERYIGNVAVVFPLLSLLVIEVFARAGQCDGERREVQSRTFQGRNPTFDVCNIDKDLKDGTIYDGHWMIFKHTSHESRVPLQ